jgi:AsmA-like C-terminal region/Protein of unknown function
MLRHVGRAAGHCARVLHWIATLLLGLVVLLVVLFGAFAWRLSQGPINLPWVARQLEAAANTGGGTEHFSIGNAALTWEGFRLGVDRPLDLRLTNLRATTPDGHVIDEIPRAAVSVAIAPLLIGRIAPRAVEIDGARLQVLRAKNGALSLGLGLLSQPLGSVEPQPNPAPDPFQTMLAELARPARSDRTPVEADRSAIGAIHLNELHRVLISDAQLVVVDQQLGATWRAPFAHIDLVRQPRGGVSGTAEIKLALGKVTAELKAAAQLQAGGASTHVTASLSPVTPAALAEAVPSWAPLAAIAAPVGLQAVLDLGPTLAPQHFSLDATLGAGTVQIGQGQSAIVSASLAVAGTPEAVTLQRLQVVLPGDDGAAGPVISITGDGSSKDGRFVAHAAVDLDQVAFADLPRLWPVGVGGGARPWITENITAGTAKAGHVEFTLEGPSDFSDVSLTALSGEIQGQDLTVNWLRPVPAIEHGTATLTILGPDVVEIDSTGGHVAVGRQGLTLRSGTMRIWGLSSKDQFGLVTINASGPLADVVTLLSNKRLRLLSKQPIPLQNPGGSFSAKLSVNVPLEAKVTMEQIAIRSEASIADAHLAGIAGGRDLDDGALKLTVDNNGLQLAGTADLAGIPAKLTAGMDFRAGPPSQVLTRLTASGTASSQQLSAAGIDTFGVLSGPAGFDASYQQQRSGQATLDVVADLTGSTLDTGRLGWTKQPSQPASLSAKLLLNHDHLVGIEALRADGPGLTLRASADMSDGKPQLLRLQEAVIGQTQMSGQIRFAPRPGDPLRITLAGRQLDLSEHLSHSSQIATPSGKEQSGPPWVLDARFDRVILTQGRSIGPMTATARSDGKVVQEARLETSGAAHIAASITPIGGGAAARRLLINASDAGVLLNALDITSSVRSGALAIDGRFDDTRPTHPLNGSAEISHFTITNAPAYAKLLQAMSLYGLVSALRGPGLVVDHLIAPFGLEGDVLTLNNARAYDASLGVTAQGQINLAQQAADIRGTIVPAYIVNAALGNIPLIGRLFSPEKGGGVFAATFALRGPLNNPSVSVNPLAALTPGFLRGLFGMFHATPAK